VPAEHLGHEGGVGAGHVHVDGLAVDRCGQAGSDEHGQPRRNVVEADDDPARPDRRQHVADGAGRDAATASEHGDPIAQLLDLGQEVARDEDGPALLAEPAE
jgi:hypothetical protein